MTTNEMLERIARALEHQNELEARRVDLLAESVRLQGLHQEANEAILRAEQRITARATEGAIAEFTRALESAGVEGVKT